MMTGVKEDSMMQTAKDLGCHLYLTKPVKLQELEARIAECFGG
jgi:DNA-binding response OmpR family regulator